MIYVGGHCVVVCIILISSQGVILDCCVGKGMCAVCGLMSVSVRLFPCRQTLGIRLLLLKFADYCPHIADTNRCQLLQVHVVTSYI